jgi:CRISPR-associated endonuclease/helicase Cas3
VATLIWTALFDRWQQNSELAVAENDRYAHSLSGRPVEDWEKLPDHLEAVAKRAAAFAAVFGWAEIARVAGLLHDIGKCSLEFCEYIKRSSSGEKELRGPDHSTAGARIAAETYPFPVNRLMAHMIAGHHAGLSDWESLERRLGADYRIARYNGWDQIISPVPASISPTMRLRERDDVGFTRAFLIRMLFSCLVDADFLETERFYAEANGERLERGAHLDLRVLRNRLRAHMASLVAEAAKQNPGKLNVLRADVLSHAVAKAEIEPGLFTLTVPTGGGKTLTSLSFALEHAMHHQLSRVVYVIPYTSIIEQTVDVFRAALDTKADILEHHASFDWERANNAPDTDDEGADGLKKLRLATENWDVPIVVTTAVQFYESLFANRTSRCRKLHNLVKSVIVLDEAQIMPLKLLLPSMAAVNELATNYGASIVLCTATQPALRVKDGFKGGIAIDDDRELAPEPKRLYAELRRFDIEWKTAPATDEEIASRFAQRPQMLAIVNTRAHAKALFSAIKDMRGACHLSTLMCPRHRRITLAEIKERLKESKPVRLVSTSLIECGVDIDFPEVWRAAAGLDTIIQSGGRCNREAGQVPGRVVVFESANHKLPRDISDGWQAARPILRRFADNPNDLEAIGAYFNEVYWQKGRDALDAAKVGSRRGILPAIAERAKEFTFPFASIAAAFEMIEGYKEPVIIPWRTNEDDREADLLFAAIACKPRPTSADFRRLQQYTVAVPPLVRGRWLALGALSPVHPAIGDALLKFSDLARYDPMTGLDLDSPELLPVEQTQI